MVRSVEGIYRNGKVEPMAEAEGSRVIVTWVQPDEPVDLRERGIDESQAADLRRRLARFSEDWDRPEMAAHDEIAAAVMLPCAKDRVAFVQHASWSLLTSAVHLRSRKRGHV